MIALDTSVFYGEHEFRWQHTFYKIYFETKKRQIQNTLQNITEQEAAKEAEARDLAQSTSNAFNMYANSNRAIKYTALQYIGGTKSETSVTKLVI